MDFKDRATLEKSVSENGTISLVWEKPPHLAIELQQSSDPSFREPVVRYCGVDPGSVVTGLPQGVHHFRIGDAATDEWSPPLTITVRFFPESRLWTILSIGAAVVLATVSTIITGHFKTRKEDY